MLTFMMRLLENDALFGWSNDEIEIAVSTATFILVVRYSYDKRQQKFTVKFLRDTNI